MTAIKPSTDFQSFFQKATSGREPYPYQTAFATGDQLPELLNVPTGVGKTATAILGWLYRRRFASEAIRQLTPRRLVYCLPMRTLVEQTRDAAIGWINSLAKHDLSLPEKVKIHLLMGGADSERWDEFPERDAILIGTQDMLLSRALNRGYGMSRYRWPVHFAMLNNDCLWVMDETQLMGVGLTTTAQLDGFRKKLGTYGDARSLWMSATLDKSFLDTRDRTDWELNAVSIQMLEKSDLQHPKVLKRLRANKVIQIMKDQPKVSKIIDEHVEGRLSLIVLNAVSTAKTIYEQVASAVKIGRDNKNEQRPVVSLLHSRYRLNDRKRRMDLINAYLDKIDSETAAVPDHPGLILISTQIVEAGFDISSVRLWSEIAPWSSVVQRLGRLNREGVQPDATGTFWMPNEDKTGENYKDSPNARRVGPYDKAALQISHKLLKQVVDAMDRGMGYRAALDEAINDPDGRKALFFEPDVVIRPDDFHQFFSTEPDLAGGFTNVAQFVRDTDRNTDVQVFWREFATTRSPDREESAAQRGELCSVPFFELKRLLGNKGVAWEWSYETSRWEKRRASEVQAGMSLLLPRSLGGYSDELGWTGRSADKPTIEIYVEAPNDGLDNDPSSSAEQWVSLEDHLSDVEAEMREILDSLGLSDHPYGHALLTAAQWHDWGKALDKWQTAVIRYAGRVQSKLSELQIDLIAPQFHAIATEWSQLMQPPMTEGVLWAKFPDIRKAWGSSSWTKDEKATLRNRLQTPFTPNLRHEAGSALAAWDAWLQDEPGLTALAVFLAASHHGKVRTILRSRGDDDDTFGLSPGDVLRRIPERFEKEAILQFAAKRLGANGDWSDDGTRFLFSAPSWVQMVAELLGSFEPSESIPIEAVPTDEPRNLGPFVLAYLESLLCTADVRASQMPGKRSNQ